MIVWLAHYCRFHAILSILVVSKVYAYIHNSKPDLVETLREPYLYRASRS